MPSLIELLHGAPVPHTPPAHCVRRVRAANDDPEATARRAANRDAVARIRNDRAALLEALRAAGPGARVSTTALARDHGMSPQRAGALMSHLASSGLVLMHKSQRGTHWSIVA